MQGPEGAGSKGPEGVEGLEQLSSAASLLLTFGREWSGGGAGRWPWPSRSPASVLSLCLAFLIDFALSLHRLWLLPSHGNHPQGFLVSEWHAFLVNELCLECT